jgi:hypothetical protein
MVNLVCRPGRRQNQERGISLIMVALSLTVILGMAALSIDLAGLYVEKSEAQRAADAGALAGAQVFANLGCTLDASCLSPGTEATATAAATQLAQQNLIFGQIPTVPAPVFTAGGGSSTDPLITVTAQAPAKTFFLPIAAGAQISAVATAEAYNPSGAGAPVFCAGCLKPFFVPNCDPNHTGPVNSNCPAGTGVSGGTPAAFFNNNQIANGKAIIGENWQLHFQAVKGSTVVPSQWLEVAFDATAPSCGGGQGATSWAASVTQCATNEIQCGQQLCTLNGGKVGPNDSAVCNLITYNGKCNANGGSATDSISCSNGVCTMTAGSTNPFASSGSTITQSSALVSVPVYDGTPQPGGGAVTVVGYMQLFLQSIKHQGSDDIVTAVIVNAAACSATSGSGTCAATGGGSGSSGTVSGGGATLLPVRLVHQ